MSVGWVQPTGTARACDGGLHPSYRDPLRCRRRPESLLPRPHECEPKTMAVKTRPVPSTSSHDVDLIVHADHWNPFSVLGMHEWRGDNGAPEGWIVRAFLPEARSAWVIDLSQADP